MLGERPCRTLGDVTTSAICCGCSSRPLHFGVQRIKAQVNVLAVEYPGYGLCPGGQADEMSVIANARLAFRFTTEVLHFPAEDIIVLGRSVGSGREPQSYNEEGPCEDS